MEFVSLLFLIFVAAVCAVYFIVPIKCRWAVLLAASYLFYWWNSAYLAFVLAGMTAITWLIGLWLERKNQKSAEYIKLHKEEMDASARKSYKLSVTKRKKWILFLGILLDLGVLLFFKYFNFFLENTSPLLLYLGIDPDAFKLDLLLPLGISFYTLQAIAYMVDMYRGKYKADHHFFKFALFMSFFPQIVQGPIARHNALAEQLQTGHAFDFTRLKYGCQLILWGFMKKLILADRIGILSDTVFGSYKDYGGMVLLFSVILYGLQVYGDFSGGMDIARGVSQIFGIELELNFRQPYFAKSIEEFWRRWHITLGAWMRDYIFYPLSLSKRFGALGRGARKIFGNYIGKKLPSFLAMFIVYFLVGFWHGSSWKYVAYGIWNGVIITAGILLEPVYQKGLALFRVKEKSYGWSLFQMFRTFLLCSVGRFFPRAASCTAAIVMMKQVCLSPQPWQLVDGTLLTLGLDGKDMAVLFGMVVLVLLVDIAHERGIRIRETVASQGLVCRWLVYWTAFYLIVIFGIYGPAYSSAAFIYQQF